MSWPPGAVMVMLAVLAAVFLRSGPSQADLRRIGGQNVLLVTIDTLRADALSAHAGAGAAALRSGDHKAAYAAWTRAVQLDSTNYEAMYNLGVNLARDGRMDAARPYLDQFLRTAPPALHANQLREASRLLQSRR